jgi:hypothetical protein
MSLNTNCPGKAQICAVLLGALIVPPLARSQTDTEGNLRSDEEIVNDVDSAHAGETHTNLNDRTFQRNDRRGNTETTRDSGGRITDVTVRDSEWRVRREITIRYNDLGHAESTSIEYRRDRKPDTATVTEWETGPDGRRTATERRIVVYDENGYVAARWTEVFQDGHWVRQNESPAPSRFKSLLSSGKLKVKIAGTGQTIGRVVDFKLQNPTSEKLTVRIPALILESVSGKNQDYAAPEPQTVELGPKESKVVPIEGVCLARNKPPVGKGVSGDLVMNEGRPNGTREPGGKILSSEANDLLRIARSKYRAADKLLTDRELEEIPYSDPKKKKDVVVQWSTWMDPRITEITGARTATKEDLKKVVYKQVEKQGPMTPGKKKKIDQGIDTIFEKIELTTAKAKDLETSTEEADDAGAPQAEQNPPS